MICLRARTMATILACLLTASPAMAQDWRFGAGAGILAWDASGTGTSPTFVIRATNERGRVFATEIGGSFASLDEQFGSSSTKILALDVQFQLRPTTRVQPYLGIGPSLVSYLTNPGGRDRVVPGGTIGVGIRADLTPRVGFVVDGRLRAWSATPTTGFTANSAAEGTVGLTMRR